MLKSNILFVKVIVIDNLILKPLNVLFFEVWFFVFLVKFKDEDLLDSS
jgi:hypothetical protein